MMETDIEQELTQLRNTIAGLRRALEDCLDTAKSYRSDILGLHCESLPTDPYFEHNHAPNRCDRDKVILEATTALAASPDEHARRIKAEALREMARLFMATAKSDLSYHNRDLAARFCNAAASELEAANG